MAGIAKNKREKSIVLSMCLYLFLNTKKNKMKIGRILIDIAIARNIAERLSLFFL
jgi:hypothetical protein